MLTSVEICAGAGGDHGTVIHGADGPVPGRDRETDQNLKRYGAGFPGSFVVIYP